MYVDSNYCLASLAFSLKNFPSISYKTGMLAMSLMLCLYKNILIHLHFFFHLHFWKIVSLDISFVVDSLSPFSAVWMCHPTTLWLTLLLVRSQLLILGHLICHCRFSRAAFKIFSLSLSFSTCIWMWISLNLSSVGLFELLGLLFFLNHIWDVSAIISPSIFFLFLSHMTLLLVLLLCICWCT